ncbi:MAG: ribosome maturation factor RimM [Clostridiales bacterium]|nr:ribosome maturation factor RimM [Clostridiales bacterium]
MDKEKIIVGKALSPHGIKGQFKVEVLSDFPDRFAPSARLWSEALGAAVVVESAFWHGGTLLVGLQGINDRDAAGKLTGSYFLIDKEQLNPLPPGRYYHFQLLGLQVRQGGELLGTVSEVLPYAANDIYVVRREGGEELLLPALRSVVRNIDLERGVMEVELPEGLEWQGL